MGGPSGGTDCGKVLAPWYSSIGIYHCTVICATASLTTLVQVVMADP